RWAGACTAPRCRPLAPCALGGRPRITALVGLELETFALPHAPHARVTEPGKRAGDGFALRVSNFRFRHHIHHNPRHALLLLQTKRDRHLELTGRAETPRTAADTLSFRGSLRQTEQS